MKFRLAFFAPVILLAGCSFNGLPEETSPPVIQVAPVSFIEKNDLKNYRAWTKVNHEPALFGIIASTKCAAPAPIWINAVSEHQNKYITVYVNEIGKSAMMTQKNPVFPVGTVIVKQKMKTENPKTTELSTVMVKREAGYNPGNGDWEYAAINAKATKTTSVGKIEHCQKCHSEKKKTDYVFRGEYFKDYNILK